MTSCGADHVGPELEKEAEATHGVPRDVELQQEILPWELDLIERICGTSRYHDVTVFAFLGEAMALIHKPSDPPGAFWAATGGVEPGESLAGAVAREAWEETGLRVVPLRYVLRMHVLFTCGARRRPWTSHVWTAKPRRDVQTGSAQASSASDGLEVYPRLVPIDTREVERAEWVTVETFRRRVVPVLQASGWGRFQYRLHLTDALFAELGL